MTPQFVHVKTFVSWKLLYFFPFTYLFTVGFCWDLFKKFLIGVWLINDVVLASGVQPSESVICISTFLKILFPYRMDIGVHVSFF